MAESLQPESEDRCLLCSNISQRKFEEVKRQIKFSPEDKMKRQMSGTVGHSPVCACVVKQPIYKLVRVYQAFLRDIKEDGIPRSCVWKSVKVFKSSFRSDVFSIASNLLARGESLNYKTGVETPLMAAITTYDEQLLGLFLDFGADVNMSDGMEDMSALGLAILLNEVSLVEMLLQHGGRVNSTCCGNLFPIQLAMNKNPAVSNILIQHGADVRILAAVTQANELFTINCPLMTAIGRKDTHLALLLLEHGEDVNQAYGDNLESPIHLAIREDDFAMLEILIKFRADLNRTSAEGHTPVGLALTLDQPNGTEIAKRLVRAGAHPNSKAIISFFQRIYTPLHIACFKGNFEFVKFLVEEVCSQDGLIGEEVEKAAGMSVQRPKKGFSVDRLLQEGNPILDTSTDVPASRRSRLLTKEMSLLLDFDWTASSRTKAAALYDQMGCFEREGEYWTRSEVAVGSSSSTSISSWRGPGSNITTYTPFDHRNSDMYRSVGVPVSHTGLRDTHSLEQGKVVCESESQESCKSTDISPSTSAASIESCSQSPQAQEREANSSAVSVEQRPSMGSNQIQASSSGLSLSDDAESAVSRTQSDHAIHKKPLQPENVQSCQSSGQCSEYQAEGRDEEQLARNNDSEKPVVEQVSVLAVDDSGVLVDLNSTSSAAGDSPVLGASASTAEAEPVFQDEFGAKGCDDHLWKDFSSYLPSLTGEDYEQIIKEILEDESPSQTHSRWLEEKLLWRRTCFLNQRTIDGSTPLFMAVFSGNVQIVNYLLKAGAGSNFQCTHGNFFHAAVLSQNMTLVNKALELNCDINHINAFGNSPLILVSRLDMPEMCRLLVENGADMNARDRFRETPLLASVYFGCESNARVLIQHGAALDLVDDK
ncbi:hypothetical protein BaRGS_00010964 [Batillaria attramentaria]|uniref:Uncharacterized protein n=1 Tax=Batillaria attramentaria TaxID=370345 RepID=A0ABD0LEQ9_9CAEN